MQIYMLSMLSQACIYKFGAQRNQLLKVSFFTTIIQLQNCTLIIDTKSLL